MPTFGDLREALHTHNEREAARILLSEPKEDWIRYARGLDPDVLAPERLAQWARWAGPASEEHAREGLWWTDEDGWTLEVVGVQIASSDALDLEPIAHEWATTPARAVLHYWEDSDHARERPDLAPLPRKAIEAKEAWCRGEITDEELEDARSAARAAWAAARRAAARRAARRAALSAVRSAASSPALTSAWSAACATSISLGTDSAAELQRWHDVWTAHILGIILDTKGDRERHAESMAEKIAQAG